MQWRLKDVKCNRIGNNADEKTGRGTQACQGQQKIENQVSQDRLCLAGPWCQYHYPCGFLDVSSRIIIPFVRDFHSEPQEHRFVLEVVDAPDALLFFISLQCKCERRLTSPRIRPFHLIAEGFWHAIPLAD